MKVFNFVSLLAVTACFAAGCKSADQSATADASGAQPAASKSTDTTKSPDASSSADATASGGTLESKFVGTWTSDEKSAEGVTFEFKPDGTLIATGPAPGEKGMILTANMHLTMNGDKGTMHYVSMSASTTPEADAKAKKDADQINTAAKDPKSNMLPPDSTGTVTWKDNDHFSVTADDGPNKGKTTNFTRKA